ncbi:hypothetical protein WDZ92_37490 [Nostoc sp. NIES-2111]
MEILVHPWLGETVEGQQTAHLAAHPEDAGCSWVIRRIIRTKDVTRANDDQVD